MLYIIGLGLGNATDITVKGLDAVKKCDYVYLELYTSILTVDLDVLENFYGCKIIVADRDLVENGCEEMLEQAQHSRVAFLVVGDPFGATTHADLVLRAREKRISVQIIHNASIINAVGCCGLQLYSFGEIVSIPLWTDKWKPDSFFNKILENYRRNLHTLCLLDIKIKEPDLDKIMLKKKVYLPPKFMTVGEASSQLLEIISYHTQNAGNRISPQTIAVGLSRVGSEDQNIIVETLLEMKDIYLGEPLHCLIVPAKNLHPLEIEYLSQYTDKNILKK